MKTVKALGKNRIQKAVSFVICGYSEEISLSLAKQFQSIDQVEIVEGDILKVNYEGIVSPANSFGEMSGGLDQAIDNHYRSMAQKSAVNAINEQYLGELPVGVGLVLHMNTNKFPYLLLAPTMRIPGYKRLAFRFLSIMTLNRSANTKPLRPCQR